MGSGRAKAGHQVCWPDTRLSTLSAIANKGDMVTSVEPREAQLSNMHAQ